MLKRACGSQRFKSILSHAQAIVHCQGEKTKEKIVTMYLELVTMFSDFQMKITTLRLGFILKPLSENCLLYFNKKTIQFCFPTPVHYEWVGFFFVI